MKTSELIDEKTVKLNVHVHTKEEALKEVAKVASEAGRVKNINSFYRGLIEREKQSTTGFGGGVAIPHAKIDDVIKPSIIVIKLAEPVEWGAMDDNPVQLLIALGIPTKYKDTLHLKLLAKLSENLMEEEFIHSLLSAKTEVEICMKVNSIF